jgi:hypothetical protein
MVLNLLPKEGNFLTVKIVHDLRMALGFDEHELSALNFRLTEDGKGQMWDDVVPPKAVEIGDKAAEVVKQGIASLDKSGKLSEEYLPICDKFGYVGE